MAVVSCLFFMKCFAKYDSLNPPSLHAYVAIPHLILVQLILLCSVAENTLASLKLAVNDALTFDWLMLVLFPLTKKTRPDFTVGFWNANISHKNYNEQNKDFDTTINFSS